VAGLTAREVPPSLQSLFLGERQGDGELPYANQSYRLRSISFAAPSFRRKRDSMYKQSIVLRRDGSPLPQGRRLRNHSTGFGIMRITHATDCHGFHQLRSLARMDGVRWWCRLRVDCGILSAAAFSPALPGTFLAFGALISRFWYPNSCIFSWRINRNAHSATCPCHRSHEYWPAESMLYTNR
jgi:hypothetical protein